MRILLLLAAFLVSVTTQSQDVNVLLKQADNFDKQVKETEAIEKYTEILAIVPNHYRSLYRLTELNAAIGSRQIKPKDMMPYFERAYDYAQKAWATDSVNADSYYLRSLVNWKLSTAADKNKEEVEHLRKWYEFAEKAIAIKPDHAKANFLLGKWNFDMSRANLLKKAAAKTIYGGLAKWDIETAITYFEKAKLIDIYFVQNYFELAKAYEFNHQPTQQIEVLTRLVKLPVRTGDDAAWKAEGKKMLEQMK